MRSEWHKTRLFPVVGLYIILLQLNCLWRNAFSTWLTLQKCGEKYTERGLKKKWRNGRKSKLLHDNINCSVLVLVSGAPLFHVRESMLLLPPPGVQWVEATVEAIVGYWELGSAVLTWDLSHAYLVNVFNLWSALCACVSDFLFPTSNFFNKETYSRSVFSLCSSGCFYNWCQCVDLT